MGVSVTNKALVEQLNKLGKLPSADVADATDFPLKEFDDLLQKFTLPIDTETAVQLINLSPPVDESCYEVEWAIIHLVEQVETDCYQQMLDSADDGEVKQILQIRWDNAN